MNQIFITGGTGYMGRRLIAVLIERGFSVTALVRKGSEGKLMPGCQAVIADPFRPESFSGFIPAGCTYVQLLGVHHPGPKKKEQFYTVDLASAKSSAQAAEKAGVRHFVYVSVAQVPVKIMQDYQQCRAQGETAIRETGLPATFIRPWYVVGPDHYWPLLFTPLFKILEIIPSTSSKAKLLRLVSLKQMLRALVFAIETPVNKVRTIEIEAIRQL